MSSEALAETLRLTDGMPDVVAKHGFYKEKQPRGNESVLFVGILQQERWL